MKTEQINLRLEASLVAAIERAAREESLDRGTLMRRLLLDALERWQLERALRAYQRGDLSLGRAAEEAGKTQWEMQELARSRDIAYPLTRDDVARRLTVVRETPRGRVRGSTGGSGKHSRIGFAAEMLWMEKKIVTLADIPPKPGRALLVGINPSPVSVAAGHYYQGPLGKRLWKRLERAGLLSDPIPGAEDEALAIAGHGLTDIVKRPSPSATALGAGEWTIGVDRVQRQIEAWKPGLIVFVFAAAARHFLADPRIGAGSGPLYRDIPTFVLPSPYTRTEDDQSFIAELEHALAGLLPRTPPGAERTQPVTAADLRAGRIRLGHGARRFSEAKGEVEVVLRGRKIRARYDPRLGPSRERSAVLTIPRSHLAELVRIGDALRVTRGLGGVIHLD